nr:hypothetical protein [Providencia thailandensis]
MDYSFGNHDRSIENERASSIANTRQLKKADNIWGIEEMIRNGILNWITRVFISGLILMVMSNANAESAMKTNYILKFKSNNALCFVKVNDMLVIMNDDMFKGNFMISRTISSFLQNGENTFSVTMLNKPVNNSPKLTSDMWCSAEVKRVNDQEPVMGVKLIVVDSKIQVDKDFYPSPVTYFGDSPRANGAEKNMIEGTKTFKAQDLPDWNWTKARPVTEADIAQVKVFYESLQDAFAQQDLEKIYQMTQGMWDTLAQEQGSTSQAMWDSMNYKRFFKQGYKAIPFNLDGHMFSTYMDGRIFRFEQGYGRVSPLEIENADGEIFTTTPYLSIIDGKVTIVK